jgi:hypothetical protein
MRPTAFAGDDLRIPLRKSKITQNKAPIILGE